jgi:tetratricopeptide (TPR) repeat protein
MDPTDEDKFASAEQLWASGDPKTAAAVHLALSRHAQSPELRLKSALVLVGRLNPGWDVDVILEACSTGMNMAEKLAEPATTAYLMGMRAKNLAILNGSLITTRKSLRLAPRWLGFSLQRDEEQYKSLTTRIKRNDEEIDRLANDAQKACGDQQTLGHVLLSIGNICFQRYMSVKSDCLQSSVRLPAFVRQHLMSLALDEYLWYDAAARQAMGNHLKECERTYSEAVAAFRAAGDELNVAYAFYALANDLRTANRFRKAKRYLQEAKTIARHHNDQTLLNRIPLLEERIRRRNRNVPDYAAGERTNQ